MSNDPTDKLAAPSFGFKKKRGGTKPANTEPENAAAEKTQVLGKRAPTVIAPEPPAEKPAKKQKAQKEPKDPSRRRLDFGTPSGLSAAVMIGAIVGAFMALAVWFSGTVSQWTRGTSSLGDKGAIVLIAIFVVAIIIGGYLLRLASARSPFTISFLGSALVAVLSMLFLTDVFNHAWGMIIVVILSAAAYALAYWVTTSYID